MREVDGSKINKKTALVIFNGLLVLLIALAGFGLFKVINQTTVAKLDPPQESEGDREMSSSFIYANGVSPDLPEEESVEEEKSLAGFKVENEIITQSTIDDWERQAQGIGQPEPPIEEKEEDFFNWGDQILPPSNDRLIDKDDVESAISQYQDKIPSTSNVPQMIINEILARHGYWFKTEEIRDYFLAQQWYSDQRDYEEDMDTVMSQLSEIEKKNIDFIVKNYR